jgi:hypothetical protein
LKKFLTVFFILTLIFVVDVPQKNINAQSSSNTILLPVCINNKYGFINQEGKVIVEPKYKDAEVINGVYAGITDESQDYEYVEGAAEQGHDVGEDDSQVVVYFSWDLINSEGKVVTTMYSKNEIECGGFKNGLLAIDDGRKYINESGKVVIKFVHNGRDFSEGLAAAKDYKEKWGFIDTRGNFVIKAKYDYASSYNNGFACVGKKSSNGKLIKYGIIDKTNKIIIPIIYDSEIEFSEGFFKCQKGKKVFYLDRNGKVTFCFNADGASDFKDGMAELKNNNKSALIDNKGKLLINYEKYNGFDRLGFGLIACELNNKWKITNKNGVAISTILFDETKALENGIILVKQKDKWGSMDKDGKVILKPTYEYIDDNLIFRDKGKYGLLNSKCNIKLPPIYDELKAIGKDYIYYVNGKEEGYLNSQNECIWKNVKQ